METEALFYSQIQNSTAHRPVRDLLCGDVLANPELFKKLMETALNVGDKDHHKACWILELVMESNLAWLQIYLDHFCSTLKQYKHDGALRSVSKVCLFAVQRHEKSGCKFLGDEHTAYITEASFDWLIADNKVATKAYAMRTLYSVGTQHPWIHPELKQLLLSGFPKHSAGYKAAAKDILKRIG